MEEFKINVEIENLSELIELLKEAQKNAEDLQSNLEKIKVVKLNITQKFV